MRIPATVIHKAMMGSGEGRELVAGGSGGGKNSDVDSEHQVSGSSLDPRGKDQLASMSPGTSITMGS